MSRQQREAAKWVAQLHGAPTQAEREAFRLWFSKHDNAAAYATAEDDYAFTGTLSRSRIEAKAISGRRASGRLRWAVATVAVAVAGLALGLAWHLNRQGDTPQIAAGPMLPGQLRLADGSTVTLMDGAWAEPQFSQTERRIRLHGGLARFNVAHDEPRPFIVVAGNSETKALGTIFEVDARSAVPKIRLVEGSVEVRLGGTDKAIRLASGESAEVPEAGPRRVAETANPPPVVMFEAEGLPLAAVLDVANKAGKKPIRLADPSLASLQVTGRFAIADSASLARKLAAALDLAADEAADKIILRKK